MFFRLSIEIRNTKERKTSVTYMTNIDRHNERTRRKKAACNLFFFVIFDSARTERNESGEFGERALTGLIRIFRCDQSFSCIHSIEQSFSSASLHSSSTMSFGFSLHIQTWFPPILWGVFAIDQWSSYLPSSFRWYWHTESPSDVSLIWLLHRSIHSFEITYRRSHRLVRSSQSNHLSMSSTNISYSSESDYH